MQRQTECVSSPGIYDVVAGATSDPNTPLPPELTTEWLSIGGRADDYDKQPPGGELFDAMILDINSGSSTVGGTLANTVRSEISIDTELRAFVEFMSQLTEYHTSSNPTNTTFTSFATRASSQFPSSQSPSTRSHTALMIRSEHQSYLCSWHPQGSDTRCNHVAPNRSAFLRHLGAKHQVSRAADVPIVCRLIDPTTGSACKAPIKRGNLPRHVDTHYPLRYHCQHCPAGTSFSRQDSWKKHVKNKHA